MEIDIVALDVDGTLLNPLLSAVVLVYSVCLAALAALIVYSLRRPRPRRLLATILAVPLLLGSVFNVSAVRALVAAIISASSQPGVSAGVGFFGHHPAWLAPLVGAAGLLVGFFLARRQHGVA